MTSDESPARPRKSLGQHFLQDENIARKIISFIPGHRLTLLEIGPGRGMLTKYILQNDQWDPCFIETDKEAVVYLQKKFPGEADRILHADFLKTDLQHLLPGEFHIVGNFPYNISSQIFFRILDHYKRVRSVTCMLQKEVARRIASPPSNKQYGILSVLLQTYFDIEYLFTVSEHVFFPPPKVKSAVIRLTNADRQVVPADNDLFRRVVKTAFNQRRKTLRNALKALGQDLTVLPDEILSLRAEQLGPGDFIRLSDALSR